MGACVGWGNRRGPVLVLSLEHQFLRGNRKWLKITDSDHGRLHLPTQAQERGKAEDKKFQVGVRGCKNLDGQIRDRLCIR